MSKKKKNTNIFRGIALLFLYIPKLSRHLLFKQAYQLHCRRSEGGSLKYDYIKSCGLGDNVTCQLQIGPKAPYPEPPSSFDLWRQMWLVTSPSLCWEAISETGSRLPGSTNTTGTLRNSSFQSTDIYLADLMGQEISSPKSHFPK